MYESPIKVLQGELETQFDNEIFKAVQRMNITVNRDELIRALRYDREQYQKGFDDARKNAVMVVRCKDCAYFHPYPFEPTYGSCKYHVDPEDNCWEEKKEMDYCSDAERLNDVD